jgi:Tfp pilus assembly protein PilF
VSIANSYLALEKPDDALRILHDAARRSRRSSALHQKIADIYVSQGRYVEAVEQYRAAVLNQRDASDTDPELKAILEGGGRPEDVAKRAQEIMAAAPPKRRRGAQASAGPRNRRFGRQMRRGGGGGGRALPGPQTKA